MFIIPFLIISIVALTYSNFFKVNFLRAVPTAIFTIVVLYYVAGFLNNLSIATYVLYLFAIISSTIYIYNKKNLTNELNNNFVLSKVVNYYDADFIKKQVFSTNFFIFFATYLIIYIININSNFIFVDEYMHWGPFIKDMYVRDKFYNTIGHIANVHLSYPPFTSLFEYFIIKTSDNICSQSNIVFVYRLLLFSPFLVVLSNFKFDLDKNIKSKYISILYIVFILLIVIFCNILLKYINVFVASISGDTFMAISFGYLLYLVLHYDFNRTNALEFNFKTVNLILTIFALILTKLIGALFFAISFLFLFIIVIIEKKMTIKNFLTGLFIFVCSILIYFSWKFEVGFYKVVDQFDKNPTMNLENVINIFFNGGGEPYQQQFLRKYINYLFFDRRLGVSFIFYIFAFFVFLIIITLLLKTIYKKRMIVMSMTIFIGFFIYMIVLAFVYLFNMSKGEALGLASIWRYLGTYFIAVVFFVIMFIIEYIIINNKMKILVIISIPTLLILLFAFMYIIKEHSSLYNEVLPISYVITEKDIDNMKNVVPDSNNRYRANTSIIAQGDAGGLIGFQFNWELFGRKFTSLSFGDHIYKENRSTSNLSLQEFIDVIKNYDYIYFYKTDDNFWSKYSGAFNIKPNDRDAVYKVLDIINN